MSPQEIAAEEARKILDHVYRHVGSPAQVEASLVPLILSAAAKMVRESGVADSLEELLRFRIDHAADRVVIYQAIHKLRALADQAGKP